MAEGTNATTGGKPTPAQNAAAALVLLFLAAFVALFIDGWISGDGLKNSWSRAFAFGFAAMAILSIAIDTVLSIARALFGHTIENAQRKLRPILSWTTLTPLMAATFIEAYDRFI